MLSPYKLRGASALSQIILINSVGLTRACFFETFYSFRGLHENLTMKNIIIYLFLSFTVVATNAQTWKSIQLDSAVSIQLPYTYVLKDTLGQKILTSKLSHGDVQILVTPDNPVKTPDIEKKKHLLKFYDNYLKKIQASSSSGTINNEKDGKLGDLYYKDFTLEVDSGRGKQHRDFRVLHENGATYVFQLLYQGMHEEYIEEDRKTFFNSIKIANNPGLETQFTENADGKTDTDTQRILLMAGSVLLIAIIIFLVMRSRKKKPDSTA